MNMTIQQVIDVIAGDDWYLGEGGCLCSKENDDCPLWYAYRHIDPDDYDECPEWPEDYVEAGRRIGLREDQAIAIAQAADNRGYPYLRKRLLKAVGLTEQSTPDT